MKFNAKGCGINCKVAVMSDFDAALDGKVRSAAALGCGSFHYASLQCHKFLLRQNERPLRESTFLAWYVSFLMSTKKKEGTFHKMLNGNAVECSTCQSPHRRYSTSSSSHPFLFCVFTTDDLYSVHFASLWSIYSWLGLHYVVKIEHKHLGVFTFSVDLWCGFFLWAPQCPRNLF